MEAPFLRRVQGVLAEELCQQGIAAQDLPEQIQEVLRNVARRLADDMEFTRTANAKIS